MADDKKSQIPQESQIKKSGFNNFMTKLFGFRRVSNKNKGDSTASLGNSQSSIDNDLSNIVIHLHYFVYILYQRNIKNISSQLDNINYYIPLFFIIIKHISHQAFVLGFRIELPVTYQIVSDYAFLS